MPGYILLTSPRAEAPRLLPKGAKAEGRRIREGKLRKAKAEALKRGLVARSCARTGRKDVVFLIEGGLYSEIAMREGQEQEYGVF